MIFRIRLQNRPGEPVALAFKQLGIPGLISPEEPWEAEDVEVRFRFAWIRTFYNSQQSPVAGINAHSLLPLDKEWINGIARLRRREGGAFEQAKRLGEFRNDTDLVAVLQVLTDAG